MENYYLKIISGTWSSIKMNLRLFLILGFVEVLLLLLGLSELLEVLRAFEILEALDLLEVL